MVNKPKQSAGYSVADAAKLLKVSTRTIRRHIKDGKLPFIKINGQFGEEYRITDLPESNNRADSAEISTELSGTLALDMIRRLEEENRNLAGQLGVAQEKIRNLEGKLNMLAEPRLPWWRRLFRR